VAKAPVTAAGATRVPSPERPVEEAWPEGGPVENARALRRLFEQLASLEGHTAKDDVRILQYGDSHTASDLGTAVLRRELQARFGDGGRGFVAIGAPWKSYVQNGVHAGMTKDFAPERERWIKRTNTFTGDGVYGLSGIAVRATKRGARAWTQFAAHASRLELAYFEQPKGGSFDVLVDGARVTKVSTRGERAGSAFKELEVSDGPHEVVRARGDGPVRVFGMTLDRPEAGVVVDTLGINGAQIFTALRWDEEHLAEQLRHRGPSLIVLAYGTNESLETYAPEFYERRLVELLGRMARGAPGASCLLLGPPDRAVKGATATIGGDRVTPEWQTSQKLLEIIDVQRRVAKAAGCAFYSQLDAMGGAGSIAAWAAEARPRAQRDRVHLTREGYAELASGFVRDLMKVYDGWRAQHGLPPSDAPRTWPGVTPPPTSNSGEPPNAPPKTLPPNAQR
jgi:lysophospholipase L1-like esterase